MKKYVYLLAMAILAIQFLSCSKNDDDPALSKEFLRNVTRLVQGVEIPTGAIGGIDTQPKEGQMFYEEVSSDVVLVTALGSFYTIDQDDNVQFYENLGGNVQTKDGGSFAVTYKGNKMHIEGSGVTHPQSGFTNHTRMSLDIDDVELIKSGKATITNIDLTTVSDVTMYGQSFTINSHLTASDIPMESDAVICTHWKGGTITEYSYSTEGLSMSLYDNPANTMEVWITFKDGTIAKARIGGS